jgi:sugar lactone lactonase YvrE
MTRFSLATVTLAIVLCIGPMVHRRGGLLLTDPLAKAELWSPVSQGLGAVDGIVCRGDSFFFCNEGAGAVQMWHPAEGLVTLCDRRSGIRSPEDLVVASDGSIFFTDDDAGGVWLIDPDRQVRLVAGKEQGLVSTEGIALSSDGTLLVGDGQLHRLYRVTRHGEVSIVLDGTVAKPESLAFDEQGNLFVADNLANKIYQLDSQGRLRVLATTDDGIASPESLCYAQGTLYITDPRAGRIYGYNLRADNPRAGITAIAALAGKLKNVQGITVDHQGSLMVTVQDLKRGSGIVVRVTCPPKDARVAGVVGT